MKSTQSTTMQITTFHLDEPPPGGPQAPHQWMAVATTHVFDPELKVKNLNPVAVILSGEAMRVINGKASAATEEAAASGAVRALLFELKAKGLTTDPSSG